MGVQLFLWMAVFGAAVGSSGCRGIEDVPGSAVSVHVFPNKTSISASPGDSLKVAAQALDAARLPVNGTSVFFSIPGDGVLQFVPPIPAGTQTVRVNAKTDDLDGLVLDGVAIVELTAVQPGETALFVGLTRAAEAPDGAASSDDALQKLTIVVDSEADAGADAAETGGQDDAN